jgi:hypothetical protein
VDYRYVLDSIDFVAGRGDNRRTSEDCAAFALRARALAPLIRTEFQEIYGMSNQAKRVVRFALFAAAAGVALAGGVGCDNPRSAADKDVQKKLADAATAPTTRPNFAVLEEAAKNKEASEPTQIASQVALGSARYNAAVAKMVGLDAKEREASRLVREIETLVSQIATNNQNVGGLTASNPAKAAEEFGRNKAKFQEQATKADALAKKLTTDIDGKKQEIGAAQQAQQKATDEAADLALKSESARGQESVDLFNKAAELRAAAAKAANDVAIKQRELAALEAQLTEARKFKAVAEEGVARAAEQIEKLNAGWGGTQQTIQARQQASAALNQQVDALSKSLATAMGEAAAMRAEVDEELERSIAAFDAAAKLAKKYAGDLSKKLSDSANESNPEKAAWKTLQAQFDPKHFEIRQGKAELQRGIVHLNHKLLVQAVTNLNLNRITPVYAEARLTPPAELASLGTTAAVEAAAKETETHLTAAVGLLEEPAKDDRFKLEAGSLHMTARYAQFALTDQRTSLEAAREQLRALNPKETLIPKLPADLELEIVTRQGAPAPRGTGRGPVTQPSRTAPTPPVEGTNAQNP